MKKRGKVYVTAVFLALVPLCGAFGAAPVHLGRYSYNPVDPLGWLNSVSGLAIDKSSMSAGDFYVLGTSWNASMGLADWGFFLHKFDRNGNPAGGNWPVLVPGTGAYASEAVVDASGNVIICGSRHSGPNDEADWYVAKYSSAGVLMNSAVHDAVSTFPIQSVATPWAVALDAAGNIFVAGYEFSWLGTDVDGIVIKYGPNLNQLWATPWRIAGAAGAHENASALVVDSQGNPIIGGGRTDANGTLIWYFAKLNGGWNGKGAQPNPIWEATIPYGIGGEVAEMAIDCNDNVYATGMADGNGPFKTTVWRTLKLDRFGIYKWGARHPQGGWGDYRWGAANIAYDRSADQVLVVGSEGGTLSRTMVYRALDGALVDTIEPYHDPSGGNEPIHKVDANTCGGALLVGSYSDPNTGWTYWDFWTSGSYGACVSSPCPPPPPPTPPGQEPSFNAMLLNCPNPCKVLLNAKSDCSPTTGTITVTIANSNGQTVYQQLFQGNNVNGVQWNRTGNFGAWNGQTIHGDVYLSATSDCGGFFGQAWLTLP